MRFLNDIYYVFRREWWSVFRDHAVLTFFILLMLAYPVVYTYIYSNEIAREVPVAVVDQSKSALSREFIRNFNATAGAHVISHCADMEEARLLMNKKKIYGILQLPPDFSKSVNRGEQAHVSLYCDMGALLNYKALLMAATDVSLAMGKNIQVAALEYATPVTEKITSSPVRISDVKLFNPQGGFTSFLMPAVLILVIQQSLLLGVGTLAGTERDRRRSRRSIPKNSHYRNPISIVLGKALAYLPLYFIMTYWVLFVVPRLFGMTQIGLKGDLIFFIFPFLLACTMFAIASSFLCKERETPFLVFVFTSIPLMFISGISWPGTAIPEYWRWLGKIFPSTHGIEGFVKINNAGAPLSVVQPEYIALWLLAFVYFVIACLLYRREIKRRPITCQ